MNCIQLIREQCGRTGIPRPNSASGSSDTQVAQLLALLNEEGSDLAARYNWQALIREATFVTVATESHGSLTTIIGAANAYRHLLSETIWNRTTGEPVYGPRAAKVWQGFKAVPFTSPYSEYRIRGGNLLFLPAPSAGNTCAFEYATKNWATDSTGATQKSLLTADEDIFLLDDELLLAGLRWRFKKEKGLSFGEDFNTYEAKIADAMAKDGTKPRLSLSGNALESGAQVAIPRLIGS
jgi:hypothetical protein